MLRQHLKHIQKELGETDTPDDTGRLAQRLAETELPEDVRTELERELAGLQRLTPAVLDYQVVQSYLEFALDLPWTQVATEALDLRQAQAILTPTIVWRLNLSPEV